MSGDSSFASGGRVLCADCFVSLLCWCGRQSRLITTGFELNRRNDGLYCFEEKVYCISRWVSSYQGWSYHIYVKCNWSSHCRRFLFLFLVGPLLMILRVVTLICFQLHGQNGHFMAQRCCKGCTVLSWRSAVARAVRLLHGAAQIHQER